MCLFMYNEDHFLGATSNRQISNDTLVEIAYLSFLANITSEDGIHQRLTTLWKINKIKAILGNNIHQKILLLPSLKTAAYDKMKMWHKNVLER